MVQSPDLVGRKAANLVTDALADTRVVTINGARQAGKSTLARLAMEKSSKPVIRLLDDATTLRSAIEDPASFVDHDGLITSEPGIRSRSMSSSKRLTAG